MKLKALVSVQTRERLIAPGELFEIEKSDGEALIAQGAAEEVPEPRKGKKE